MKKAVLTSIAVALAVTTLMAQAQQRFNYQGVARDNTGAILATQSIALQISILSGSPTGTVEYSETHATTTNQFGLFTLQIGNGTVVSGDFTTIDWGANTHYTKVEMDATGGANYQLMGTSQLLSVPYALHAENVTNDNVNDADADPTNELQVLTISNDTIYLTNGGFVILPTSVAETDPIYGSSIASSITVADTANWNNHTIDTDTQLDSTGVAILGYVAGTHTIDTQLDSIGVTSLGFVAGAHTIEVDADTTNELQTLSLSNDTLNISNGNSVILTDADPTNELQNLSLSGDTLFLSNGNYILLGKLIEMSWRCEDDFTDDRDGKVYSTVKIGNQCWMAENLNYGTYVSNITGQGGAGTQKYCWGNNTANCTTYGGLYEWTEMMDGAATSNTVPSGVQGVCPTGWHIPSDAEWCILENTVEAGTDPGCSLTLWRGTNTGGDIKQTGTANWTTPNTGATNISGFTALPGGYSWSTSFSGLGQYCYWWCTTENNSTVAWFRNLSTSEGRIARINNNKGSGYSVRCVKD